MACFIVPLTQAIATTALRRRAMKTAQNSNTEVSPWISQLPRLEAMLYGGSAMLIVDHILTGDFQVHWLEILTIGVPMSLVVTGIFFLTQVLHMSKKSSTFAG